MDECQLNRQQSRLQYCGQADSTMPRRVHGVKKWTYCENQHLICCPGREQGSVVLKILPCPRPYWLSKTPQMAHPGWLSMTLPMVEGRAMVRAIV
jgi:hypothetical protein